MITLLSQEDYANMSYLLSWNVLSSVGNGIDEIKFIIPITLQEEAKNPFKLFPELDSLIPNRIPFCRIYEEATLTKSDIGVWICSTGGKINEVLPQMPAVMQKETDIDFSELDSCRSFLITLRQTSCNAYSKTQGEISSKLAAKPRKSHENIDSPFLGKGIDDVESGNTPKKPWDRKRRPYSMYF